MESDMPATADITTRCPQCNTAFRVTSDVLNIAHGTVRCGSCLWVFNAHEFNVEKPQETDESWALELLKQEEEEEKASANIPEDIDTPTTDELPFEEPLFDETSEEQSSEPLPETPEEEVVPSIEEHLDSYQSLEEGLPDDLDLDRIELHNMVFTDETPQEKRWHWILGSIAALLVLTLQFAWLRFDTLGQYEPYRHYYQLACNVLSCELPTRSDLQKIITSHLVVRSHPDKSDALQVDAIIVNDADFEQHFPALRLVFRNIHNDIVSSRYFQPSEYLRGDLIGATLIPARQAVQLSLAIVDPGESAINYHLEIASADIP